MSGAAGVKKSLCVEALGYPARYDRVGLFRDDLRLDMVPEAVWFFLIHSLVCREVIF